MEGEAADTSDLAKKAPFTPSLSACALSPHGEPALAVSWLESGVALRALEPWPGGPGSLAMTKQSGQFCACLSGLGER